MQKQCVELEKTLHNQDIIDRWLDRIIFNNDLYYDHFIFLYNEYASNFIEYIINKIINKTTKKIYFINWDDKEFVEKTFFVEMKNLNYNNSFVILIREPIGNLRNILRTIKMNNIKKINDEWNTILKKKKILSNI